MNTGERIYNWFEEVSEEYSFILIEKDGEIHRVKVDSKFLPELLKIRWFLLLDLNTNYVQSSKKGLMHRYITGELMGLEIEKKVIDHLNRNGLDNTSQNLRVCTHGQNIENARKKKTDLSDLPKGVYYSEAKNSYIANWYEDVEGKRKRRSKNFNVNKLGRDEALKQAINLRKEKEKELGIIS